MNKEKEKKSKTKKLSPTELLKNRNIILCESCDLQCTGHGGGHATHAGGCFCNDGTYLDCIKGE